jgi:hypothetical protein
MIEICFSLTLCLGIFYRSKKQSSKSTTSQKKASSSKVQSSDETGKPRNLKQVKKLTAKVTGSKSLFNPNKYEFSTSRTVKVSNPLVSSFISLTIECLHITCFVSSPSHFHIKLSTQKMFFILKN